MDDLQLAERFERIERRIEEAAQACRDATAPPGLAERLAALRQRTHEAREVMARTPDLAEQDPARLFEQVDGLKSLGDEVSQSCDADEHVVAALRESLQHLRDEIAQFRRQLHGRENRRVSRPAARSGGT